MQSKSRHKDSKTRRLRKIRDKAPVFPGRETFPRFVADVMLGRLAKWLRIAGFDVLYSNRFTDDELVTLSRREGRILLSRDTHLLVRRSVEQFIFLESEHIQDQIRQIFTTTNIARLPGLFTRCLGCNELLTGIPREEVRNHVPPYVFATQAHFKYCPRCGKVYWAGTHRRAVLSTMKELLG